MVTWCGYENITDTSEVSKRDTKKQGSCINECKIVKHRYRLDYVAFVVERLAAVVIAAGRCRTDVV